MNRIIALGRAISFVTGRRGLFYENGPVIHNNCQWLIGTTPILVKGQLSICWWSDGAKYRVVVPCTSVSVGSK